ncbi:MAG: hypothetical protein LBI69_03690 [Puniceicoccales bacterium]|jgi:hypothetical protein|nr:hypothetical protein [Puniceicoccales bacterium]
MNFMFPYAEVFSKQDAIPPAHDMANAITQLILLFCITPAIFITQLIVMPFLSLPFLPLYAIWLIACIRFIVKQIEGLKATAPEQRQTTEEVIREEPQHPPTPLLGNSNTLMPVDDEIYDNDTFEVPESSDPHVEACRAIRNELLAKNGKQDTFIGKLPNAFDSYKKREIYDESAFNDPTATTGDGNCMYFSIAGAFNRALCYAPTGNDVISKAAAQTAKQAAATVRNDLIRGMEELFSYMEKYPEKNLIDILGKNLYDSYLTVMRDYLTPFDPLEPPDLTRFVYQGPGDENEQLKAFLHWHLQKNVRRFSAWGEKIDAEMLARIYDCPVIVRSHAGITCCNNTGQEIATTYKGMLVNFLEKQSSDTVGMDYNKKNLLEQIVEIIDDLILVGKNQQKIDAIKQSGGIDKYEKLHNAQYQIFADFSKEFETNKSILYEHCMPFLSKVMRSRLPNSLFAFEEEFTKKFPKGICTWGNFCCDYPFTCKLIEGFFEDSGERSFLEYARSVLPSYLKIPSISAERERTDANLFEKIDLLKDLCFRKKIFSPENIKQWNVSFKQMLTLKFKNKKPSKLICIQSNGGGYYGEGSHWQLNTVRETMFDQS